jgi:hypothetical protein
MRFACSRGPATPADAGDRTANDHSGGSGFEPQISQMAQIFEADQPGWRIGTDPRELAYQVMNLEISVRH